MATANSNGLVGKAMRAASAEHENTVTADYYQDNAATSADVAWGIPADTWVRGDVFEFWLLTTVNDNNSTDTLTEIVRLSDSAGTPNDTDMITVSAFDAADNDYHIYEGRMWLTTAPGTSATFEYAYNYRGVEAGSAVEGQGRGTGTVDTTTLALLRVEADWSVAHADNEAELSQGYLRKVAIGGGDAPCPA